ncbi:hypothetical protein G9396_19690 [Providencia rettgeri]|nr:hypothetical protein [Providencia rettgeri]QKJ51958.1 hypothetical protein G9396_19690 [Providencia rettgeri]
MLQHKHKKLIFNTRKMRKDELFKEPFIVNTIEPLSGLVVLTNSIPVVPISGK